MSQRLIVDGTAATLTASSVDPGTTPVSEPLYIGARNTLVAPFIGNIAELIAYDSSLGTASLNIVENYISAKYATTLPGAVDFYTGDDNANGDYDFDVFGIGRESDGAVATGTYGNGLTIAELNGSLDVGEYVMAGDLASVNSLVTNDLAGSGASERWARDWYLDESGDVDVSLAFDASDAGVSLTLDASTIPVLLYRPGQTGDFSSLAISSVVVGDTVTFTVLGANWLDGFYTLGIAAVPEPSTFALLGLSLVGLRFRRRRSRS